MAFKEHFSHPHPLTLLAFPAYPNGTFTCDACGIQDNRFCFHCRGCSFDLHIFCACMPISLNHPTHPHTLCLTIPPPSRDRQFICDMCNRDGFHWYYYCEPCNFTVHLACAINTHPQAAYMREALTQYMERVNFLSWRRGLHQHRFSHSLSMPSYLPTSMHHHRYPTGHHHGLGHHYHHAGGGGNLFDAFMGGLTGGPQPGFINDQQNNGLQSLIQGFMQGFTGNISGDGGASGLVGTMASTFLQNMFGLN